ncbi:hypothetical protein PG997_005674 [Apiospora hydei]|uniref:Uncharacterized protein n=1 Tax=Apiospora hydei TaxID=1337664 RepID=A0ABR1WLL5_9PEZI
MRPASTISSDAIYQRQCRKILEPQFRPFRRVCLSRGPMNTHPPLERLFGPPVRSLARRGVGAVAVGVPRDGALADAEAIARRAPRPDGVRIRVRRHVPAAVAVAVQPGPEARVALPAPARLGLEPDAEVARLVELGDGVLPARAGQPGRVGRRCRAAHDRVLACEKVAGEVIVVHFWKPKVGNFGVGSVSVVLAGVIDGRRRSSCLMESELRRLLLLLL